VRRARAAACVPDHSGPAIGGGIENIDRTMRKSARLGGWLRARSAAGCRWKLSAPAATSGLFGPVVARRACRTSDFTQGAGHASPLRYSAGFIAATSSRSHRLSPNRVRACRPPSVILLTIAGSANPRDRLRSESFLAEARFWRPQLLRRSTPKSRAS
jgi:hypothetical protein